MFTYGVQDGEEERGAGADLVELDVRVERDVLVQRVLLHLRDQVPRHGEEEEAEVEGETGGGASRDGDADAHDVAQVEVLRHEGVEDEPLKKLIIN